MPTPETVQTSRKKLNEARKLNRSLKQEYARNEAVISQLRSILSAVEASKSAEGGGDVKSETSTSDLNLSFLTSSPSAQQLRVGVAAGSNAKHTPLTTNTTFILSQFPVLQATLRQLRPKLETLPKSTDEMVVSSKRDERKEYIESRIRLHLERAGQLAIGSDGNHLVAGRKIDAAEAQALEVVTGMLTAGDKKPE